MVVRTFRDAFIVVALVVGCLSTGVGAAEPGSARDVLDGQIKTALGVLRDAKLTQEQKRQKIIELADQQMDFETMSRLTLGRYWRDLSPDQRASFVEAFRKHLSNTYGKLLNGYTDEDVVPAADHQEADGDCTVQLRVIGTVSGARQELATVDCRLRRKAQQWKVIDVTAVGVSVVSIFRAQFQSIMANGGFDRLLKLLRDKANEPADNGAETHQKQSRQSWGGDSGGALV